MRAALLWMLLSAPVQAEPGRVDLHLHVTMDRAAIPLFHGEPGKGETASSPSSRLSNQVDYQGLHDNKLWLALGAMWPPISLRPGRDALGESLHQVDQLREFCREQPAFGVATTPKEARRLHELDRIALLPALEGGEGIEQVDDVDVLFKAGVRAITIVHFADNDVGGAAAGQVASNVFGVHSEARNGNGLSPLGKAVVKRMAELGIIVDLAHSSDRTSADALDILEPLGVPALITHAAARRYSRSERAIDDELLVRVVKGGGMVGLPLYDKQVRDVPEEGRFEGMVPGTCDDVLAHWLHDVKLVEPSAVTLGSDFNGFIVRPKAGGSCPNGLRGTSDLGGFYAGLEKHGEPLEAIDGAYERFLKLWETVEAHASNEERERARQMRLPRYDLFDTP